MQNVLQPVLILDSSPRVVVAIARSLHRCGITVDVGRIPGKHPRIRSRSIRQVVDLPNSRHSQVFIARLTALIKQNKYDMLIPATDEALVAISQHDAVLRKMLYVACPEAHIVDRVLDKRETLRTAAACGIPVANTYPIENLAQLLRLRGALCFPLVAKVASKKYQLDFKVRYFRDFQQLNDFAEDNSQLLPELMFQEYCPGEGIGIEILMVDGEPLVLFQHRRLKQLPRSGGVSVLATAEPVEHRLADCAVRLLRSMQWNGVAMVEFRHDRERNRMALMEVNGRYWGSLPLSRHAGIDFPIYEWQVAHGQCPEVPRAYRYGVRVGWLTGDLLAVAGVCGRWARKQVTFGHMAKEVAGLFSHMRPGTGDAIWSVKDPLPALIEFHSHIFRVAKRQLASLVPQRLVVAVRAIRRLSARERGIYWKLWLRRSLGLYRRPAELPSSVSSVLFICHGNIIRSPLAAALLREQLASKNRSDIIVRSAGLNAQQGKAADPTAQFLAEGFSISLAFHRAEPLTDDLVRSHDCIVLMDYLNQAEFYARYPQARPKTFLLGELTANPAEPVEVSDPYGGKIEDYQDCFRLLGARVHRLASLIRACGGQTASTESGVQAAADVRTASVEVTEITSRN